MQVFFKKVKKLKAKILLRNNFRPFEKVDFLNFYFVLSQKCGKKRGYVQNGSSGYFFNSLFKHEGPKTSPIYLAGNRDLDSLLNC